MKRAAAHGAKEAENDAVTPDANQSAHLVVSEQDSTTAPIELYLSRGRRVRAGGSKGEATNTPRTTLHGNKSSRLEGLPGGRNSFPLRPPAGVWVGLSRRRRSKRHG